jgi:hypothetical protein
MLHLTFKLGAKKFGYLEHLQRFDLKLKTYTGMIDILSLDFIVVGAFKFDWPLTTPAVRVL